ncbi:hypothetical protein N9971_00175 [bacterium]|nr:hypothetical protein [bacterium]
MHIPGIDELDRELNLRERAATAAEAGAIRPEDTVFDDGQFSVTQHMGDLVAQGRSTVVEELERHESRRGELSAELEGFPRQPFDKTVDGAVTLVLREHEEEVKATHRREEQSRRALNGFRVRHRLTRPARYPEWRIMHWAIVFVLFLVESIANSYFFAKASDFGLIGGWLQAAIISAFNIGVGLLAGMVVMPWRNRAEANGRSKAFPTAVVVLMGFFIVLFNLATAHYRVLLEESPREAIRLAIGHLVESPFAIDNFDAWILLFVGIMFASIAWIEGYKSDDPLREYGRLDRDFEKARTENASVKTALRDAAVSKYKEIRDQLANAAQRSKILIEEYRSQISRSKVAADEYRSWRDRMEEATRAVLSRYRSYYLSVDELAVKPPYFEDEYVFDEDRPFLEEEKRINNAEGRNGRFEEISKELERIRDESYEGEKDVIECLQTAVDKFLATALGLATEEIESVGAESRDVA